MEGETERKRERGREGKEEREGDRGRERKEGKRETGREKAGEREKGKGGGAVLTSFLFFFNRSQTKLLSLNFNIFSSVLFTP